MTVGCVDGVNVGCVDGVNVGCFDGVKVGTILGDAVLGVNDGLEVGRSDGVTVGFRLGFCAFVTIIKRSNKSKKKCKCILETLQYRTKPPGKLFLRSKSSYGPFQRVFIDYSL